MTSHEKKIWFPAKKYGWGWGAPACWQGWATIIIFYLLVGGAALHWMPKHPKHFVFACILLLFLLIGICYLKGEKPRWRWGKNSEER
jgi:hypothetical protein